MIEFIDKTENQSGTPINRKRLMGLQGYESKNVIFEENLIRVITEDGMETTTFEENQIIKTFSGEKTITAKTTFEDDGYYTEVL